MGIPVVIKTAGGMPVTVATSGYGVPMTVDTNGYGIAVTQAANGLPVSGITFGPDVTAPVITSSNSISNVENTVLAHTLTANELVTWAIVAGGADNARFEISGSTLRWLSNGTKDFEAPNDANTDNAYIVTVRATDLASNPSTTQTITVTVTDVTGVAPAAPVLALTSGTSDNTPDFTLTGDLLLNDTVRFQYSTSAVFSGASEITNTIDSTEDAANVLNFSTGTLANGTWYFRARIERPSAEGAGISGWSNTETIAISVVASYTGPGDLVTTGWKAWYGMRAFSVATIGNPAIRLKRADAAELDIVTLSSGALDIATATTFIGASSAKIMQWYDQTGNGQHLADPGGEPNFAFNAVTTRPGCVSPDENPRLKRDTATVAIAQPYSMTFVAKRTSVQPYPAKVLAFDTQVGFPVAANTIGFYYPVGAAYVSVAATDSAFHDMSCTVVGGAHRLCVDGVDGSSVAIPTSTAGIAAGETITMPDYYFVGTILEAGICATGFDATQRLAMAANQAAWYGHR